MTSHARFFAIAPLALAAALAHAAAPVIYPARGQGAQQQEQDKFQCYGWAREQSGYDPMNAMSAPAPAAAPAPPPSAHPGGMAQGAAMGAAVGEVTGHDAGRGAAVGVLGGAILQGAKQRQAAQSSQQQAAAQQQAARQQQKATFERSFAACMEGRGYVLK